MPGARFRWGNQMERSKTAWRMRPLTDIDPSCHRVAAENRRRFREAGVVVVDVTGSPGSGKSSLIGAAVQDTSRYASVGVVVGDETALRDAGSISSLGVPTVQVATRGGRPSGHIDAMAVSEATGRFDLYDLDILFVEQPGGLARSAGLDIGQVARVVVLSVSDGEDVPLAHPASILAADLVLLNKTDLLARLDFDTDVLRVNVGRVSPDLEVMCLSCRKRDGIEAWIDWVRCPTSPVPFLRGVPAERFMEKSA